MAESVKAFAAGVMASRTPRSLLSTTGVKYYGWSNHLDPRRLRHNCRIGGVCDGEVPTDGGSPLGAAGMWRVVEARIDDGGGGVGAGVVLPGVLSSLQACTHSFRAVA